jgi:hypothetical protein
MGLASSPINSWEDLNNYIQGNIQPVPNVQQTQPTGGYWNNLQGIMGPGAGLANWWRNQGRFQENPQIPRYRIHPPMPRREGSFVPQPRQSSFPIRTPEWNRAPSQTQQEGTAPQTIYPGGYAGWRPGKQRYASYIPSGQRSLM